MSCLGKEVIFTGLSLMIALAVADEAPSAFWSASPARVQITKSNNPPVLDASRKRDSTTTEVKERENCSTHYGDASKDLCLHWLEVAGASVQNDEWNIADGTEIMCLQQVTQKCCAKREITPVETQTENRMVQVVIKYDENFPSAEEKACPLQFAMDKATTFYKYTYSRSAQELLGYYADDH